jgi:hypothetical protein
VIDACRRGLRAGDTWRPLARRPVLFALARTLAEAWPGDVERETLIASVFRTRRPGESHRARLRVEIGRLRTLVAGLARIEATARGFALDPRGTREVAMLVPPIDGDQASLVALLSDGAAWSTRRWLALLLVGFTTILLLPQDGVGAPPRPLRPCGEIGMSRLQPWLTLAAPVALLALAHLPHAGMALVLRDVDLLRCRTDLSTPSARPALRGGRRSAPRAHSRWRSPRSACMAPPACSTPFEPGSARLSRP